MDKSPYKYENISKLTINAKFNKPEEALSI